jgi:DNA-directed RNA polymerase subunit RPC12/RpoP
MTKTIKVYSCSCCGRGFESQQQENNRVVL